MPRKRTKQILLRMTAEEADQITREAESIGLSREQYMRDVMLRHMAGMPDLLDSKLIYIEVANNLGELTDSVRSIERTVLNTGQLTAKDRVDLRNRLSEIYDLFLRTVQLQEGIAQNDALPV